MSNKSGVRDEAIRVYCEQFGVTLTSLAERVGVTRPAFYHSSVMMGFSLDRALAIERETGGAVRVEQLKLSPAAEAILPFLKPYNRRRRVKVEDQRAA